MSIKDQYQQLKPLSYHRVIDVLEQAQIDISDWKNFKGTNPATNPQVYQWSFEQPGERVALFLWWKNIKTEGNRLTYQFAPRKPTGQRPASEAKWKASSNRFRRHVQTAFEQGLPVAAIIVDGTQFEAKTNPNASRVKRRLLDPTRWAVADFNYDTHEALLVRGMEPVRPHDRGFDSELSAFEGWRRPAFVWHRYREGKFRDAKIAQALEADGGRLKCEVPKCRFDFEERYGKIGKDFAHVHHKVPLSKSRNGRTFSLKDLAVVCANCHAMIHIGGQCRPIETLIP